MKDIENNVIPGLIKICDWLKANKLSLNALKTELMLLGKCKNRGSIFLGKNRNLIFLENVSALLFRPSLPKLCCSCHAKIIFLEEAIIVICWKRLITLSLKLLIW